MNLCLRSIHNNHSNFQSLRSKDVSFLAVCVADQCNVSSSVRIVLDTNNSCRNSIFSSLEIDDSIFSSGSTSAVSHSDFTLSITSCVFLKRNDQRFLRSAFGDLREIITGHMSSGRCIWAVCFDSHYFISFQYLRNCRARMHIVLNRLRLTVPQRSRCLCCLQSAERWLFWFLRFCRQPCHVSYSFRRSSWCLRSVL